MSIKHAILGLLADGPRHGYGLKAGYEAELAPGSTLNIGQVYPALGRLQEEGHVTVEAVSQTERPDRKVYTLTDNGRRELEAWLASPSKQDLDLRNETCLKLVLAWRLGGAASASAVLGAERRAVQARRHEVAAARARAEKEANGLPAVLMLDLAELRLGAFHQWLDRCEETLCRGEGS